MDSSRVWKLAMGIGWMIFHPRGTAEGTGGFVFGLFDFVMSVKLHLMSSH